MGVIMERISSGTGRVLALVTGLLVALGLINTLISGGTQAIQGSLVFSLLLIYLAWLLFWQPNLKVSDGGVIIVNLLRTHQIPWDQILRIDTRWALQIDTEKAKYTAWSAPAPGRHTGLLASKDQGQHLPSSSYIAGTVRPGDLVNTDSGAAAAHIRRVWEEKRGQSQSFEERTSWSKAKLSVLLLLIFANAVLILI